MCYKDVHTCAQLVLTVSTLVSRSWKTVLPGMRWIVIAGLRNCANLWSTVTGSGETANGMGLLGFRLILLRAERNE